MSAVSEEPASRETRPMMDLSSEVLRITERVARSLMRLGQVTGIFVISLDFELFWGIRDRCSLESVSGELVSTRSVIPKMLSIFTKFNIRTTWATVGFLFFDNKNDLCKNLPETLPAYSNAKYSPYAQVSRIGQTEREDPYHFGLSLIRDISRCPGQEIGTHTFSHFFALEGGQSARSFEQDLQAASSAAQRHGLRVRSLVFPRNQCNEAYLSACHRAGITTYRGNPRSWIYRARKRSEENGLLRAIRLLDAYLNLTGHHVYPAPAVSDTLRDIPASRFLRPWSHRLRWLEPLRLRRIKRSMTYAAQRNCVFHLWWHPENFGRHPEENLHCLTEILDHYQKLHDQYGMRSCNMSDFSVSFEDSQIRLSA